jgi:RimJ/RimL family protein N-acetyltransferase
MDDLLAVHRYQNDPLCARYYEWEERSEDDVRASLQRQIDFQSTDPRRKVQLAVTRPETGEVIGNCGVRRKDANDFEADIGYEIAPAHWGKGYATEAAIVMVRLGFGEWGLHRVSAWCVADNLGSARVLEKAGLKLEGRLVHSEYYKRRWWDTLLYGVIAEEWLAAYPSPSDSRPV